MTQDRMPRSTMPSIAVMMVVCAAVLFGAAGRLDIIEFWCWIVELAAIRVGTVLLPLIGACAVALLWRIYCELILVSFDMHDKLAAIAARPCV